VDNGPQQIMGAESSKGGIRSSPTSRWRIPSSRCRPPEDLLVRRHDTLHLPSVDHRIVPTVLGERQVPRIHVFSKALGFAPHRRAAVLNDVALSDARRLMIKASSTEFRTPATAGWHPRSREPRMAASAISVPALGSHRSPLALAAHRSPGSRRAASDRKPSASTARA